MSVIGSFQKANQQSSEYNNAAQAAEYNAAQAQQNAVVARQQAGASAEQQRMAATKHLGTMRASYGASGVTMEGSATDVLAESAGLAELDRLNILYGGELKAAGYEQTAALDRNRAAGLRQSASSAKSSGWGAAGAALIGGGLQAYGMMGASAAGTPVTGLNSVNSFDDGSMYRALNRT
jgi:hypothetical protein